MNGFEMLNVGRIVFGRGSVARLPELIKGMGSASLVIHNVGRATLSRISALLDQAATEYFELKGEPKVADVQQALDLARSRGCDCIIGLGGGSAIDAAKATAGLLGNGGEPLDYMEVVGRGRRIARPAAPWIAVPTTAGTGAEATRNAVISCPEKQFKASIRSELLLPRLALIDAELHVDLPPETTASSGMDALCQLIESYTSTGAQPVTDALAIKGIELASRSLLGAYRNGKDIAAREDMALAALLSGVTLSNAGLGAVHGFAAPLGGNFPIPHGVVCAALLPHVIEANVAALRAQSVDHPVLRRYADVGRVIRGKPAMDDGQAIDACVQFCSDLLRQMSIPRLSRFGLSAKDVAPMVELAKKASSMRYNPVALDDGVLAGILEKAL